MSAPYAPPSGGYPAGPPSGYQPAPAGPVGYQPPRSSMSVGTLLTIAIAGDGLFALFLGGLLDGLSYGSSGVSMAASFGWATALLSIAGLLAAGSLLKRDGDQNLLIAAISLGTSLALLFALFEASKGTGSVGSGFIITLVLGFLMSGLAIVALLSGAGLIKMAPKPAAAQPGPGQVPYGYPQGYPQPQQPGQQAMPPQAAQPGPYYGPQG